MGTKRYYGALNSLASVLAPSPPNRLGIIGDSHLSMGCAQTNMPTTPGSFVVKNGVATLNAGGNINLAVGNYVYIINRNDSPLYRDSLNGACVKVVSVLSNSTFTVSASFNNQTMADGDYSNTYGGAWALFTPTYKTDSSWLNWLRYLNQDPFILTSMNAAVGQTSQDMLTLMPKVLAGPVFDVGVISAGTNEIQAAGSSSAAKAVAYQTFLNITAIAQQLIDAGIAVGISTSNPDNINNGNTLPKAQAMARLRRWLWQWARRHPTVQVLDTFAVSADGTSSSGLSLPGYIRASTDVHLSTVGDYNVGKQLAGPLSKLISNSEIQPVAIYEDSANFAQLPTAWAGSTFYAKNSVVRNGINIYSALTSGTSSASGGPKGTGANIADGTGGLSWTWVSVSNENIVSHGFMDGVSGTNSSAGAITGTVPTGWILTANGLPAAAGTSTGGAARTAQTNTNAAKWGFGWQIAVTFTGAGQSWQAQGQDLSPRLIKGGWYRFGATITALNGWGSVVNYLTFYLNGGGGTMYFQPTAIAVGNNSTTYPLLSGDPMEVESEPFFIDPSWDGTQLIPIFNMVSAAAGAANLELASMWCEAIEDWSSY